MESVSCPSASGSMSPPRKRNRKMGVLSEAEKQAIINCFKICKERESSLPTDKAVAEISKIQGVSTSTIYRVLREYKIHGCVKSPKKSPGRPSILEKALDDTSKNAMRRVVHSFFFKNEIPTLNKIMVEIKDHPDIPAMSRATLHAFLRKINFRYEKRNRRSMLIEKSEIKKWRREYLRQIEMYREEGYKIFYLDETWVNAGHTVSKVWTDSNIIDARQAFVEGYSTGLKGPSGKGHRLIILHVGSEEGFVDDMLLLFEGKKTADYHEEMNSAVFEEWFDLLLTKIPEKSVIVMDNASYHSRREEKIPTSNSRKAEMQEWLANKNITFDEDLTRSELLDVIRLHKVRYTKYVTDERAKKLGKLVLRLPPYHCELNPIELIWAQVKGEVARKNKTFKLADVKKIFEEALKNVTPENWKKCVDHILKEEKKMKQLNNIMDDVIEPLIININNDDSDEDRSFDDSSSEDKEN